MRERPCVQRGDERGDRACVCVQWEVTGHVCVCRGGDRAHVCVYAVGGADQLPLDPWFGAQEPDGQRGNQVKSLRAELGRPRELP